MIIILSGRLWLFMQRFDSLRCCCLVPGGVCVPNKEYSATPGGRLFVGISLKLADFCSVCIPEGRAHWGNEVPMHFFSCIWAQGTHLSNHCSSLIVDDNDRRTFSSSSLDMDDEPHLVGYGRVAATISVRRRPSCASSL